MSRARDFPPVINSPRGGRKPTDGTPPIERAQAFGIYEHAEADYAMLPEISTAALTLAANSEWLNASEHLFVCEELNRREVDKAVPHLLDYSGETQDNLILEFWSKLAQPQVQEKRQFPNGTTTYNDNWDDMNKPARGRTDESKDDMLWRTRFDRKHPLRTRPEGDKALDAELKAKPGRSHDNGLDLGEDDDDDDDDDDYGGSSSGGIALGSMHAGSVPL